MPTTRISPKHQITIPKPVFDEAQLAPGDILDATTVNGKIVLTPKRLADKIPAVKLSANEQKVLAQAQAKMTKINNDILNSEGLTKKEIEIASKVGLINTEQAYFWTEEWQKDVRSAEQDIHTGDISPAFDNAEDAIAHLHKEAAKI
jgi:AbrB family looped-hinge helix DNA binding protein